MLAAAPAPLSGTKYDRKGVLKLATALQENTSLTSLDLARCSLGSDIAVAPSAEPPAQFKKQERLDSVDRKCSFARVAKVGVRNVSYSEEEHCMQKRQQNSLRLNLSDASVPATPTCQRKRDPRWGRLRRSWRPS